MLEKEHNAFSPPETNCTLWRYMDLTKLLSLLESQQLFFPRADMFDDPYDGVWSRAGVNLIRDPKHNNGLPPDAVEKLISHTSQLRKEMFISCWHMSEHESAAMWKLYLQSSEGIAIRSDHDALCSALEQSIYIAGTTVVRYIDYDSVPIPFGNLFFPFVHKRLSFSHEQELRAIIWIGADNNKPQIQAGATSVTIDVVPDEFIKAIHVSPTAPKWFGELIKQLVDRYNLTVPVEVSDLYDRPSY